MLPRLSRYTSAEYDVRWIAEPYIFLPLVDEALTKLDYFRNPEADSARGTREQRDVLDNLDNQHTSSDNLAKASKSQLLRAWRDLRIKTPRYLGERRQSSTGNEYAMFACTS
ncbi:hypothetical protein [Bradyrhizobium yuanmingense]|uniref:hypothetical protein n=1 Tax=Bradyrhizobium yuanmingense TaxID=108015 RepID=UPI0012E3611C|nr:hypothetical protein [Bradyrhizobium yuanmingense]